MHVLVLSFRQLSVPARLALGLLGLAFVTDCVTWYVTGGAPGWIEVVSTVSYAVLAWIIASRRHSDEESRRTFRTLEYVLAFSAALRLAGSVVELSDRWPLTS